MRKCLQGDTRGMLQSLDGQRAPVLFRVGEFRAFAVLVPVFEKQEGEGDHRECQECCARDEELVRNFSKMNAKTVSAPHRST